MLERVNLKQIVTKEEYQPEADRLRHEISVLQQTVKKAKLPVIVLFEGWGAAGKGSKIAKLILNLDPRGFAMYSMTRPTPEEQRYPFLKRYWEKIPQRGDFSIFDRSWYQELSVYALENDLSVKEIKKRASEIEVFERQLRDDGYLIVKFFLHISNKEQKKRLKELEADKHRSWRVTKQDWKQNDDYDRYYKAFDRMLEETSFEWAPWHVVPCEDRRTSMLSIYRTIVHEIQNALDAKAARDAKPPMPQDAPIVVSPKIHLVDVPKLQEVPLNQHVEEETYRKELDRLQKRLHHLAHRLYQEKIPVVIGYEGWDAAGKGGNIKRVAAALDPRDYQVLPIAAPDKGEFNRHYLWRFWKRLPKSGHIAIFDRTWYGRLMVERLEGLCTSDDWHRAYQEINEFEKELIDWGALVVKFWIQIDKDEQLRRFNDRANTSEKQWKLTDEDWRNREKWDLYEGAINDMLRYTSTDYAPWQIIESQDKRFARIKALTVLIREIENRLKD